LTALLHGVINKKVYLAISVDVGDGKASVLDRR
jgi:hypothetical protein